jgi:hypothetical protein
MWVKTHTFPIKLGRFRREAESLDRGCKVLLGKSARADRSKRVLHSAETQAQMPSFSATALRETARSTGALQ